MKKILLFKKKNKTFHLVTLNSSCVHHSTLWKSWNMQSGLNKLKKDRIVCIGTNTYIYVCTNQKRADHPVPTSTAYSAALQHVLSCMTANKQHEDGNLGLRVWCQKVPNCFVSLWTEDSEVYPRGVRPLNRLAAVRSLQLYSVCSY